MKRAVVAAYGWPANLQLDAVYPYTTVDSKGKTLTGANKYTLTFAKGETPPVNGFWSITMYEVESDGWWFVPNPLNKFTVSPRNKLEVQRRRFGDPLLPERVAGQGQGSQLAARTDGRIHPNVAHVLAEGHATINPRRKLEAASRRGGSLIETRSVSEQ